MQFIEKKKFYYIDSDKRQQGTSSNFTYKLLNSEGYTHISVMQATIPYSYFLIQTNLNDFILTENSVDTTVNIPIGNYNINSFAVVVSALLTAASPSASTYAITFNDDFDETNTNFLTITITGSPVSPQLKFNTKNTINEQFGFDRGETVSFSSGVLSSNNSVNYLINRSLLIHCNVVDASDDNSNILQDIYAQNNQLNSSVIYQATEALMYGKKMKVGSQNVINIYLSDVNNVPINLNGRDLNMTIVLYSLPKPAEVVPNRFSLEPAPVSEPVAERSPPKKKKKEVEPFTIEGKEIPIL